MTVGCTVLEGCRLSLVLSLTVEGESRHECPRVAGHSSYWSALCQTVQSNNELSVLPCQPQALCSLYHIQYRSAVVVPWSAVTSTENFDALHPTTESLGDPLNYVTLYRTNNTDAWVLSVQSWIKASTPVTQSYHQEPFPMHISFRNTTGVTDITSWSMQATSFMLLNDIPPSNFVLLPVQVLVLQARV